MTSVTAGGGASPARLRIKITRVDDKPDPAGQASWQVFGRRWLIAEVHLGYVSATERKDALTKARAKWPAERRLSVYPA